MELATNNNQLSQQSNLDKLITHIIKSVKNEILKDSRFENILAAEAVQNQLKTVDKLFNCIKMVTRIDEVKMKSKTRKKNYVESRMIFSVIAEKHLAMKAKEIGEVINRDRCSVIHSLETGKILLEMDEVFEGRFKNVERLFLG